MNSVNVHKLLMTGLKVYIHNTELYVYKRPKKYIFAYPMKRFCTYTSTKQVIIVFIHKQYH
jgi:chlorite dismutase